jgi:heptosyltransferase-3
MQFEPRKILVIATPVMGDVLLSTPLVRSLAVAWPDAAIDVLTRPGGAAVLEGNRDVHDVIELPKKPPPRELAAFLLRRFRKYDLVLSNSASDRAFAYSLVMGKRRVSLVWNLHSNLGLKQRFYDHWTLIDEDRLHTIPQNLKLAEALGVEPHYDVVLPRAADGEERIADVLGKDWAGRRYAVLHPDTAAPIKRWTKRGWHDLIRHLDARGLSVFVTGGPSAEDRDYLETALDLGETDVELLAGKLRLGDVTLLLEHAAVYIGVDTLITHMAAAAGTPTVGIFGPFSPVKWGPWPRGWRGGDSPWQKDGAGQVSNVTIVRGRKQCEPCGEPYYVKRTEECRKCLESLDAEAVIAGVDAQL